MTKAIGVALLFISMVLCVVSFGYASTDASKIRLGVIGGGLITLFLGVVVVLLGYSKVAPLDDSETVSRKRALGRSAMVFLALGLLSVLSLLAALFTKD